MDTDQLRQRWLAACVVAALLANLFGGLSVAVTAVFVVIYLTGAALIGRGDEGEQAEPDAEPYPELDEPETIEPEAAKSEPETAKPEPEKAKPEPEAIESEKTESRNAD